MLESAMSANVSVNLSYLNASRTDRFTHGIKIMPWEKREGGQVVGHEVVTIIGSVGRDMKPRGPFKPVPVSVPEKPVITRNGKHATFGSFQWVEMAGGKRLMLTGKADGNVYLHVHAGFELDHKGNIDGHVTRLLLDGIQPHVPGSFSLDGGSVQLENVEGLEISQEKAERLKWARSSFQSIIGGPGVKHDLWRIPRGAAILIQDPAGKLVRVVHENGTDGGDIKVVDADGPYRQVFMDLEMRRRAEAQKAKDARSRKKGESSEGDKPA